MLNNYIKNTSGNMASIFAVSIMLLLMAIGTAVDLNYMSSKKTSYQSLADLAVLAAARSGETDLSELLDIANTAVAANNFTGETVTTRVEVNADGRIQVFVEGQYDTMIMGLFGKSDIGIGVMAEAPLTTSEPVNVALVLDVTSSMGGTKIESLKTAATKLVDILGAFDNDALKIAVVPFQRYVNVGQSRRGDIWLDVDDDWVENFSETCSMVAPVIGETNCRSEPYAARPPTSPTPQGTCYNDGVPYACGGSSGSAGYPAGSNWVCDNVLGPEEESCNTPGPKTHTWSGCVGSRINPWHERVEYAAGKKVPGLMNETRCNDEILSLTNNLTSVKTAITNLSVGGNTYIPSGLTWGWRALDIREPLTESSGPFAANTKNVMILMTDGANTISKTGETHTGSDTDDANDVTETLCENINLENIEIYTIAYEVTDPATINLMRDCASSPDKFYDASNSASLKQAFEDIGQNLLKLRLTH